MVDGRERLDRIAGPPRRNGTAAPQDFFANRDSGPQLVAIHGQIAVEEVLCFLPGTGAVQFDDPGEGIRCAAGRLPRTDLSASNLMVVRLVAVQLVVSAYPV